jgi:glycosyltransferase involved in cell wall biosynthesis
VRTAIFSTYPPRACGIGTFSSDVRAGLLDVAGVDDVSVIAVVDQPSSPQRSDLLATVVQGKRGDYVRAARLLGRLDIDVVLVQHEYGIFGGADGEYILSFAKELSQPLVVTLHTVLSDPTEHQSRVLAELCEQAETVIVMTETARRLLRETCVCAADKVRVVPHGAPVQLARRRRELLSGRRPFYVAPSPGDYAQMQSRLLLSTFGLISPGKGLETALAALPAIVERHPEVMYLIAGRTHPQVARREGELYRVTLERCVVDLGLGDHVTFDDRFLSTDELADLLAVTDVFITPYRNREQIASGALTFAIAAGCAAVSTPYWYAEDLLASGAGRLIPFGDAGALSTEVLDLIEQPGALAAAQDEARTVGNDLAWPSVAKTTAAVLREAALLAPRRAAMPPVELQLTDVRRDHLLTLVDDVGIVQHALGVVPNRDTGYCVDDVARLVSVALELAQRQDDQPWTTIVYRALSFLYAAVDDEGRGMRNFMSYDRQWLDEPYVGDHVGRSIWALGEVLSTAWVPAVVGPALGLLDTLVASLRNEVSLHTAAYAVLGLSRIDRDRLDADARTLLDRLVRQLSNALASASSEDWRWFEDELRYDSARLPHALIVGSTALGRDAGVAAGLDALAWLGDECGLSAGVLRLPGHLGRRQGQPTPGQGDEQPLDATAFVEAELAAYLITNAPVHRARAQRAFEWFLGRNRLDRPLYDFATGGCSDGLGQTDVNANQGAESTLAFHRAELRLDAAGLPVVLRHSTSHAKAAA